MSDQSHAEFVYDELPKSGRYIRRLHLQPGDDAAKLVCHLEAFSLENYPDYEALSYCWGSESSNHEISCNGNLVTVTPNLQYALQDLRNPDKPRILWVDALCINQSDDREKTQQVAMMSQIYQQARKVVVHLGPGNLVPDISLAIDLMRRIAATDYKAWPYISPSGTTNQKNYSDEDLVQKELPSSEHTAWKALGTILGRPWFERAWVRQEVILAQDVDVFLGPTSFPWSLLAETVRRVYWIQNDTSILQSYSRLAYNLQSKKAEFPKLEKQSLLKVIWDDFTSEATDPRDRIFAYVSMAKGESPVFKIDYSLSVAQVFTRFTLHCLQTNQNLEALDAVKDPEFTWTAIPLIEKDWLPQGIKVPSWVNDWNRQIGDRTQIVKSYHQSFKSSGDRPMEIESADDRHLTLRGMIVDTIESIAEFLRDENWNGKGFFPHKYRMLSSWEELVRTSKLVYEESSAMVFFRTILEQPDLKVSTPDGNPETFLSCWYQKFGQGILRPGAPRSLDIDPEVVEQYAQTAQAIIHNYAWMTRLFTTKRGYIGTTQRFSINVQAGDLVCLLYGGRWPYILRPRGDGTHRFLGACYIEALIHGQGLEWPGTKEESFILS